MHELIVAIIIPGVKRFGRIGEGSFIHARKKKRMPLTPLGKFIVEEMKRRNIKSAEAFAELVEVAQSTISAYISEATPKHRTPSHKFVDKLSDKLGVPMVILWPLAYPERANDFATGFDPRVLALAERLSKLPDSSIDLIFRLTESLED